MWSITSTSIGSFFACSFKPSRAGMSVNTEGGASVSVMSAAPLTLPCAAKREWFSAASLKIIETLETRLVDHGPIQEKGLIL